MGSTDAIYYESLAIAVGEFELSIKMYYALNRKPGALEGKSPQGFTSA